MRLAEGWQHKFAIAFDDLTELDKRTKREIFDVCRWARKDAFWSKNFCSPAKLRKRNQDGIQYFDVFVSAMAPTAKKQTGFRANDLSI